MKSSKLVCLLMAAMAVAVVATGCKSPQHTKVIPHGPMDRTHDVPPGPPIGEANKIEDVPPPHPVEFDNPSDWTHDSTAFEAQTIYFAFDSTRLNAADKMKAGIVAAYLQSNPRNTVLVEGNCDERGTEEYNRALGERRALAAREALIAAGIEPKRVTTISYGEDKPADPGHDDAAWKKNRRAVFVLLTPLR